MWDDPLPCRHARPFGPATAPSGRESFPSPSGRAAGAASDPTTERPPRTSHRGGCMRHRGPRWRARRRDGPDNPDDAGDRSFLGHRERQRRCGHGRPATVGPGRHPASTRNHRGEGPRDWRPACKTAFRARAALVGGHTEVTQAVTQPVIVGQFGLARDERFVSHWRGPTGRRSPAGRTRTDRRCCRPGP